MSSKIIWFAVLMSIMVIPPYVNNVYGHGLGGDVAPPIDFGGSPVTVSTKITPSDLTAGEVTDANLEIRFFDTSNDETFKEVTYRVEIWRSGELLARNLFFDLDGVLDVKVRPIANCNEPQLWKCTEYYGSEHSSAPGALFAMGKERPVIQGPIFDKGGLYNIRVDVEGATSPRTTLAQVLSYDTFVSVADEQPFTIKTASAEIPVIVKTYYDQIQNFSFDPTDNSVSFDMPFDWSEDYISNVKMVHEELRFPKSFTAYGEGKNFVGYVDGVKVDQRVLITDPYSLEDQNIIHFLVSGDELKRINDILGEEHQKRKTITFDLIPSSEVQKNEVEFYLVDPKTFEPVGTNVNISWDSKYGANEDIPFEVAFFDDNGNLLKNVKYGIYLIDQNTGSVLLKDEGNDKSNPGIRASEGIDYKVINIPTSDPYRVDIVVFGQGDIGLDFDPTHAGIGSTIIEVGAGKPKPESPPAIIETPSAPTTEIPFWIKNNAGWWADGQIDDNSFIQGIQYLIKEGIMTIPPTEQGQGTGSNEIPSWIKNNARWWADGQIDDDSFIQGIQYLIKEGIMTV